MEKKTNRRFRVAILSILMVSGTVSWLKVGLTGEEILKLASIYQIMVIAITGGFFGFQTLSGIKKNGVNKDA